MVKLRRVTETSLYLESQKNLDDLKAYLGEDLFNDYMEIRDKLPSISVFKKTYPDYEKEDELDLSELVKKYNTLRKSPIIQGMGNIDNYPSSFAKVDSDNLEEVLSQYSDLRDYALNKITDYKDFQRLKKIPLKDVEDFLSNFQTSREKRQSDKSSGAKKIYSDSDWDVYRITTYPASQYYGKGTKWCISGNYGTVEKFGEAFFKAHNKTDYIYFYINKHNSREKYAVLKDRETSEVSSIWDSRDENLGRSLLDADIDLPYVEEIGLKMYNKEDLFDAVKECEDDVDLIEDYVDDSTINATDSKGYTPLMMAANRCFMNVVEYLIKCGADVNAKDNDGISSLAYACLKNDYDVAKLLIDNGADVNVKTKYGTLLQCTDDNRIKRLLIDHGAKID